MIDLSHHSALFMVWIYACHIYHPIFFRTGVMDWIHHVPVYILNTLCFTIPSCNAIHLQSLIMMGIPGGLDYLLQVLEGEGKLSRAYYKELCSMINVYVRAPLGAWNTAVSRSTGGAPPPLPCTASTASCSTSSVMECVCFSVSLPFHQRTNSLKVM